MVHQRVSAHAPSAASRALLAEPITFHTAKISAKNRFLKGAMTERLCSFDPDNLENISTRGYPSQTLINVYEKWAYGNFGVVLTGNVMIDPTNLEASGNLIVSKENDSPRLRELLKQLADAGKKNGTVFIAQVGHAGRQTPISINPQPWSASDVQLTKGLFQYGKPKALTTEQVQTEVIDRFVLTAMALYEAGFHGIELHGAHGYLLAQFLSPTTNLRTDKYGGPIENRARVVLEVYDAIRKEIPASTGFVIGIKLNSVEFQEGGLRTEDAKKFAVLLEQKGFDFIEVSGGNYEQLGFQHFKESTKKREAYFLEFAEDIKKSLKNLRVYVTGGFRTAEGMAAAVRDGATDGIGLARPTTAEFDLPTVLIEGKGDSAADTKIPESDLWLAVVACDTQMWQAGQTTVAQAKGDVNYGIVDLSSPETIAKYSEAAGPFVQKAVETETSGKSFYGVLQYPLKTKA